MVGQVGVFAVQWYLLSMHAVNCKKAAYKSATSAWCTCNAIIMGLNQYTVHQCKCVAHVHEKLDR